MGTCAICCQYFNSFKKYQEHHMKAHNVHVLQINKIQPVRHTTRTKMEIVHDYETMILKPYLIMRDSLDFVGMMYDGLENVPFYHVNIPGHEFNDDVLSLEYMRQLEICKENS